MTRAKITPEQILAGRNAGLTQRELAAKHEMSTPAINRAIKRFGIDWHDRRGDEAARARLQRQRASQYEALLDGLNHYQLAAVEKLQKGGFSRRTAVRCVKILTGGEKTP